MLEIRFRAGTKNTLVAGILFFILYRQIIFFEQLAGTKFHAGMLEIRFRAGTKTLGLPVYYFSYCTGK